jgi:hypothetical protein
MLKDCNRNVRDAAHQTLIVLMKYGDLKYLTVLLLLLLCVPDDVWASIPALVCQRLAGVLEHSEGDIRHIALETLRAFLDHGDFNIYAHRFSLIIP